MKTWIARLVLPVALSLCPEDPAVAQTPTTTPAPPAGAPAAAIPGAEPVPDLAVLLDGYRSPQPAATGVRVRARSVTLGHLEIRFDDGVLFLLLGKGGAPLGLYFDGGGHYLYRSEDPADRQVMEANITHQASNALYHDHSVEDAFTRLTLFFAAPLFEDLWGGAATPGGASESAALTAQQREGFDKVWKRIGLTYLPYDHLAAEARLNGGGRQYVYAEIDGARETVGYWFDRAREFDEGFCLFRKPQGVDIRFQQIVSDQSIEGGAAKHPEGLALMDIRIDLATRDNRTATINSDLTLRAGEDGVRVARFRLLNSRDPDKYNWASPKNRLDILAVKSEDGGSLPFSHRYGEVLVLLPQPTRSGADLKLRFETRGDILTDRSGRQYDNYFELMSSAWFPRTGIWLGQGYTFGLKARVHKPFVPIASGLTVAARQGDGIAEVETRSEKPVRMIALIGGVYVTEQQTIGGRTIRAHAYAAALKDSIKKIPPIAAADLSFYEQRLGPYPFGDLDVVEIPGAAEYGFFSGAIAYGIAPPGMVMITGEAYNPRKTLGAGAVSHGVNARLAHEIAHQWFPHQAGPADQRDDWLSESVAEYLSGLLMGAASPDTRTAMGFPQMLDAWRQYARTVCRDAGPIEAAEMLSGPDAYEKRSCLLYDRGPLVLHMLRAMAGDERFFAILRRVLAVGALRPVRTADLQAAAREVLKADLGWFFDDWYGKGGIPEIRVTYTTSPLPGDKPELTGFAVQAAGESFRRVLIPLLVEYETGAREVRLVFQDQPVTEFRFELPALPKKVRVDPFQNNLATYR